MWETLFDSQIAFGSRTLQTVRIRRCVGAPSRWSGAGTHCLREQTEKGDETNVMATWWQRHADGRLLN